MSSHIFNVLKQAIVTFTSKKAKPETFATNLQNLIALLDKTTAEHVNLPSHFLNPDLWNNPDKAPVSCIGVYEDDQVSMGIFILKPNGKLPLHNHPQMHGLIKVIAGRVKIVSYSIDTEKTKEIDEKSFQGETPPVLLRHKSKYGIVTAELGDITVADTSSPTCTLEPDFKNLHEIQSLDEPAAFLDILAPPYDYPLEECASRHCSYYTRLSQVAPNIFRLQEIRSPSWYWTDSYPYTGPDLFELNVS
ncbi:2-aminoethanethiol dioxygenase [Sitophilus oryzae]|uniref:2-aminoethanethiol dioxygenase n=1 Tax=Sitophilus oryzae TaxID=7048 RepID=A0A6J2XP61_SITOR|nr:2-aminoethanethiol dioxygenase [Sitophilus oryzae]